MSFNVPSYETKRLSFGPGRLYISASGITPTTDIGAVDATMALKIKRTFLDLYQGSPKTLAERKCVQEDFDLEITAKEWNLSTMRFALGAGELTEAGTEQTLELGGDMEFVDVSLRFVHQTPNGGTVTVDVWKANGSGEVSVNHSDEWTNFPLKFSATEATTNWAGATLADKKKKIKIHFDRGA